MTDQLFRWQLEVLPGTDRLSCALRGISMDGRVHTFDSIDLEATGVVLSPQDAVDALMVALDTMAERLV